MTLLQMTFLQGGRLHVITALAYARILLHVMVVYTP